MAPCALCDPTNPRRAILRRPKTAQAVCRECFFLAFETEVHLTIMRNKLFRQGERVGVAASGGKGVCCDALYARIAVWKLSTAGSTSRKLIFECHHHLPNPMCANPQRLDRSGAPDDSLK